MKKRLLHIIANTVVAAGLSFAPLACPVQASQMDALVAGKYAVVGSIADLAELRNTLSFLQSIGVQGAFIVSAREAKQYPENVQLIVKHGHTLIIEMQGKQNELRSAAGTPKQEAAQAPRPNVQVAKKPAPVIASAPVSKPVDKKPVNVPAPKLEEQEIMAGPPLIIGHTSVAEPSFRERAARGRQQQEQQVVSRPIAEKPVATKEAVAKPEQMQAAPKAEPAAPRVASAPRRAVPAEPAPSKKIPIKDYADLQNAPEGKPALKAVGTNDNRNLKIDRPKLTKKERVAREFLGTDEYGRKVVMRYPETAKDVHNVPDWTLASLTKLSDYGLLLPAEIREILSEPNRELLAKLITRAYHENEENRGQNYYDAKFELEKLMREYDTELRNLGYEAGRYAAYSRNMNRSNETRFGGELRYNYVDHEGDDPFNFHDSRVRLRLYVEQPLDDDWTLYGMGEGNKSWYRDVKHFSLERLFIRGKYKELQITGGRFGEVYADGNVYDGRVDGLRLSGGDKVKLTAEYGRLRDEQRVTALMASYSEPRYDAEAGVYILDKLKSYGSTTIGSLGGMYYIGNFGVGAMYLCSSRTSVTGGAGGYVVTLKYGRNRSWIPGTYEIFAKYYSQPDTTYISHTMVGLADYMRGFKGFGVGWYYTLAENVVYGIEYYDLEEKGTGKKGRSLWNHVSVFF